MIDATFKAIKCADPILVVDW